MMNIKTGFALAALGFAAIAGGNSSVQAAALTLEPIQSIATQTAKAASNLEKVHYRHGRKWRRICARRWGRGNRRFRRCLRRHDVGVYYPGRKVRRICGKRWGWGTRRFRRCIRRHR
ncbi:MAG: hypothetical protein KTR19_07915 [Hyphomicrobiales bacterium]|nr:hypothetical protein [Hyphomicrobiales bacterium]